MHIHAKNLLPIVIDFLSTYYGEEEAEEFAKIIDIKITDTKKNPLIKAGGFNALLKTFLKANPHVKKALLQISNEESSSEDDSNSENESSSEDEKPAPKRTKKVEPKVASKKVIKKEESESSSDSSEDEKPAKASKAAKKTLKIAGKKRKQEPSEENKNKQKKQKLEESDSSDESEEKEEISMKTRIPYSRIK